MDLLRRLYTACRRFPHRHGYGIHSPFAYELITGVLCGRFHYYAYEELGTLRKGARLPRCPRRTDELLFRLVNRFQPECVVEAGTGAGLSILYMAAAKKAARCVAMDSELHEETEALLEDAGVEYRRLPAGGKGFLQGLPPVGLLHIAHVADCEALFEEALPHVTPQSVIVVEGIRASKARREWWKRTAADGRTGITFDLYETGLVFFDRSRPKQHYTV